MAKKRSKLEIVHTILENIRARNGKIKPTHILYKSNLSYQMMETYLEELKQKGLITELQVKRGKTNAKTYAITDKGLDYLDKYRLITEFAETFGLE